MKVGVAYMPNDVGLSVVFNDNTGQRCVEKVIALVEFMEFEYSHQSALLVHSNPPEGIHYAEIDATHTLTLPFSHGDLQELCAVHVAAGKDLDITRGMQESLLAHRLLQGGFSDYCID